MFTKGFHIGGNIIVAVIGVLMASDLTAIMSAQTAGIMITVLGVVKTIINAVQGDPSLAPK